MKYTYLGRTGLKVSRLCLGTMNFGAGTSESDSFTIMDKALESGINFFDTADGYTVKKGEGDTEQIIGRWLDQGNNRREKVILATKAYYPMGDGPNDCGLSAYHIKHACEGSLRRLKTDHIDLYQMHHIDRNTSFEEIWQAMEQLVREGKILYAGSSNFAGWQIAKAQSIAKERHFMGLVSEQSVYNLFNRIIELEVIPACREYGLGLLPWSPLSAGLLAGSLNKARVEKSRTNQTRVEKHRVKIEMYESFCQELGKKPSEIALSWLLHNPVVTAPIIGPRTLEQLESNIPAVDIELSADVLKKLDEIWPGPGGEAPEAYYARK